MLGCCIKLNRLIRSVLIVLSVLLLVSGNRHQMRWRKDKESRDIEKDADASHDDADLDLFKDDDFFKGSFPTNTGSKNISIQIPQFTIPQFQLPQFNINKTGLESLLNIHDKTNVGVNSGTSDILDFLAGLIGFSSTQQSVRPIVMILLALATGVFWCKVFLYIYTSFFSGGGWFSDSNQYATYGRQVYGYGHSLLSNMDLVRSAELISRAIDVFRELNESGRESSSSK